LSQIIGVTTIESDRRHLKLANLVITPNLGTYSLLDFNAVNAISDLGYKAATENAAALEKFALDETDWQTYLAARDAKRRTVVPTPATLKVDGTRPENSRAIEETLNSDLDKPIDPAALGSQLSEIRGGGRYESLDYTITRNNGLYGLQIHARDKTYGPALLIPIVQLRSSNISDVKFSIGGRFTIFDVGSYGSELRVDTIVGSDNLLGVEYFRPLGERGFFVAPHAEFAGTSVDLFAAGDRVAEYRQRRIAVGLNTRYIFNRRSQISFGYEVGREQAKVSIGDPLLPTIKGLLSDVSARFVFEGHDSAMVPTRGISVNTEARWFFDAPGATQAFPQAEIRASDLKPLNDKSSLFMYGGAGTTFSKSAAPLEQFTLGGPFRLSAFGPQEFRGDKYVLLSSGYLRRVGYLPEFLGRKIYGAGWYEVGSAFFDRSDAVYRSSVSGAVIMETRLGPLVIGGAVSSDRRGKIFVSMGRLF
jgi:NTE family protein